MDEQQKAWYDHLSEILKNLQAEHINVQAPSSTCFVGGQHVHMQQATGNQASATDPDSHVKEAIQRLMEQTQPDGTYVFQTQTQWYAVYRILVDYHHWPDSMAAFERRINDMQLALRVPCKEESFKKINTQTPYYRPFEEWKPKDNPTLYNRLRQTAQHFKQLMDQQ